MVTALVVGSAVLSAVVICVLVLLVVLLRRGVPAAATPVPERSSVGSRVGAGVALDDDPDELARRVKVAQQEAEQARRQVEQARQRAERESEQLRNRLDAEAAAQRSQLEQEVSSRRAAAERDARSAAAALRAELEADLKTLRGELDARQQRIDEWEQRMVEREQRLDAESRRLEASDHELTAQVQQINARRAELADVENERRKVLERVACLSAADAKTELVHTIEHQAKREAAVLVRDIEAEARENGEARARHIVTDAIQRVASEQTSESVVTVLHLPTDDMKGRIIGREGRNIRAFETLTGVNLIIDDTPEAVLLSCFDPVRREVARLTLEKLVLDGRIHPHRIEEVHERAKGEVDASCVRAGEDALVAVGITDVHPELVALLGRLRYRTSYGQNVLKHLIETAHIAGLLAAELKMDPSVVKRGAFLHDIGKALTHEVEGSHALVGADLARRYGESPDVVHAIEAHHDEVAPQTIEAVLTQASDSCSGGRPGARRESLESYVKRLARIEEIAAAKPGVDKVFAMQAGREVRVMVLPDQVDDLQAQIIAREVARQIEEELTYPGQVRVTVIRESRASETAH